MKRFAKISIIKRSRYVMIIFASVLSVCILLLAGLLFIYSPGKAIPYLDGKGNLLEGSISEKVFIDIGGVRQGMFIKSKNSDNPVLLYLHGGMPFYFLAQNYPVGLEEHFTVVWWEQRGSGISYSDDIPVESMTLEQMISDTMEYLTGCAGVLERRRFISWGTPEELSSVSRLLPGLRNYFTLI